MSQADAAVALKDELRSLELSCRTYDTGKPAESSRIATHLRAIFHDQGPPTSLLARLNGRFISLLTTAGKRPDDNPSDNWPSLVLWELDPANSRFFCIPKLGVQPQAHRHVKFDFWWNSETIYQLGHKKIRRRDLVVAAGRLSEESSAPLNPTPDFAWLVNGSDWKATLRTGAGQSRDIGLYGAHHATIRQIAHEALNSRELLALAEREAK
jgi:hypothetical protein